jgi:hypothetical protein
MATIFITKEELKALNAAFEYFFTDGGGSDARFIYNNFVWENRREFTQDLTQKSGFDIKPNDYRGAKEAIAKINQSAASAEEEKKEEKPDANRPTTEQLEILEAEAEKRTEAQKKALEDAKIAVERAIEKQQKLHEQLKGRKIYARVETTSPKPMDEKTAKFIETAKNYPISFEKDLAEDIKQKVAPSLSKTLGEDEIDYLSKKTAYDTVHAINDPANQASANTKTAILNAFSKEVAVGRTPVSDSQLVNLNYIQNIASEVSFFENSTQTSRVILGSFDPNLAESVFGPSPESYHVSFSSQPVTGDGAYELDFGKLSSGYGDLLSSQRQVFDNLTSFGGNQINNFLLGQARNFIDSQVANLPLDSTFVKIYNSAFGQEILSFFNLGKPGMLGEGVFGNIVQQIPGASSFFEGLGNSLGIDFGFAAATPAAGVAVSEGATVVGGSAITGGIETGIATAAAPAIGGAVGAAAPAAGTAVGAVVAPAAGAAVGTAGGAAAGGAAGLAGGPLAIITAVIGAVIGFLGSMASKINWKKMKGQITEISLGALAAGIFFNIPALIIGGGVGLVGGLAGGGISSFGSSLSGLLGSLGGLLGAIMGAFLATIAGPIIITIFAFPLAVGFILLVINSGAYIVPSSKTSTAINCIIIADNALPWPGALRSNVEEAATAVTGAHAQWMNRVCAGGEVNLCYDPPQITPGYYAWHVHDQFGDGCDVYFNEKGVGTEHNAEFMITHELTHHIQHIDNATLQEYQDFGAYAEVAVNGFCSYGATRGSVVESMAEACGLYASIPSWVGCIPDYASKYPMNYSFAQGFMD